ncbi:MAG: CDP-diacylglycerol--glycerol-3-phosphate 3-phosphatidyltransferase [Candidatus Binatia bacterium]|nr:MAG: CDP-diacylglycerol--glycerol-3-phosphate 3-phosphatidyltransferase [Candidatus Binatia bacterium]
MTVAPVPNVLTLFRVATIPLLVVLLLEPGEGRALLAALAFLAASLSDFLDGYLARRHNVTTSFGKLFDPLADKLLVVTVLVMLVALPREPRVPAWMAAVLIGREIAVTGLRAIASQEGIVLAAERLGKYKMAFQILALHGLLLHYHWLGVDWHAAGMYFLWISLVLSVWSAAEYHRKVYRTCRFGF